MATLEMKRHGTSTGAPEERMGRPWMLHIGAAHADSYPARRRAVTDDDRQQAGGPATPAPTT
jgi:hypothetical protein